ncbi:MAG: type Z 30S ribosomal protein S14 [Planctomycetota bacterium]|nr:type Z 30S ribosomal protein S14 [Planctomycetota bacterium]MCZ6699026.1 type Z 30S ribosomal protein S14 [Planctomycetota bacterium]MCZ6815762.1 type Z 30S ribosomal protein S14 [Planctomycetota bacterium]
MARKGLRIKAAAKPKFSSRGYTRCQVCGRARAVYRKFLLCRICFRNLALDAVIPGVRKASW